MHKLTVQAFGDIATDTPPRVAVVQADDAAPGPGELAINLKAAGVNPVDAYIARGTYAIKPDVPYTPGMDAAGVVAAVGEGVTNRDVGDRVWLAGTADGKVKGAYANRCICKDTAAFPLPDDLSFAQGAAINVTHVTAYRALHDVGRCERGQSVLIHGATGGVGLACVQLARMAGLDIWATGGSEAGRQLLVDQGVPADQVIDHHAADHLAALPEEGVDLIVEMLANVNLPTDLDHIASHGKIVVVGNRGEATIDARKLMGTQASITGLTYWSDGDAAVGRALAAIAAGVSDGHLRPVVDREFPLADCLDAWRHVLEGTSGGKVVLIP